MYLGWMVDSGSVDGMFFLLVLVCQSSEIENKVDKSSECVYAIAFGSYVYSGRRGIVWRV